MSLSTEEIKAILREDTEGELVRFKIYLRPRVNIFRFISEETVIWMINAGANTLRGGGWDVEKIQFLPVDGNPNGVIVTASRVERPLGNSSFAALTGVGAAVAIIGLLTVAFVASKVERITDNLPAGALESVGEGFKFGAIGFAAVAALALLLFAKGELL